MYQKTKVILNNCDCIEYMQKIPDLYFDLAVCDIPYGINVAKLAYTQEENRPCRQKNGTILRIKKLAYKHKDWDKETPSQKYYNELKRISKHQIIFGVEYVNWIGLGTGRIKWNKLVPEGISFKSYEMAYCSMIDYTFEFDLLWTGMNQAKSLKEPRTQQGNKKLNEKRIHPTHKPTLLYTKLYLEFAKPEFKIIDTHLGSGSSLISAEKFGISEFHGCEIDADYFNDMKKRYLLFKSNLTLDFNCC